RAERAPEDPHLDADLPHVRTHRGVPLDLPAARELDRRPTSIGKAIPNTEILVINEHGRLCAPGEVGELVHRGPTVSLGYWGHPDLTAKVLRPNQPDRGGGGALPHRAAQGGRGHRRSRRGARSVDQGVRGGPGRGIDRSG